jgi:hypothetical protein
MCAINFEQKEFFFSKFVDIITIVPTATLAFRVL